MPGAIYTCPDCGGKRSRTTAHACRVRLHPQLTAELEERRSTQIPVVNLDDPTYRYLEELWALDLDAPLDAYLDGRS